MKFKYHLFMMGLYWLLVVGAFIFFVFGGLNPSITKDSHFFDLFNLTKEAWSIIFFILAGSLFTFSFMLLKRLRRTYETVSFSISIIGISWILSLGFILFSEIYEVYKMLLLLFVLFLFVFSFINWRGSFYYFDRFSVKPEQIKIFYEVLADTLPLFEKYGFSEKIEACVKPPLQVQGNVPLSKELGNLLEELRGILYTRNLLDYEKKRIKRLISDVKSIKRICKMQGI